MVGYGAQDLKNDLRKRNLYIIFTSVIFAVIFAVCVILAFTAEKSDQTLISVLTAAISTVAGWTAITIFLRVIAPLRKRIKLLRKILCYGKTTVIGEIVSVRTGVTSPEGVSVSELTVKTKDGDRIVYFEPCVINIEEFNDKKAVFTLSANFIVDLKAVENEED